MPTGLENLKIYQMAEEFEIELHKIKFFIGYSGWTSGQLQSEIDEKSWITSSANRKLIFDTAADKIWKTSLHELGGEYEQMTNYPIDPQLN